MNIDMNKNKFLFQLEQLLLDIPVEEKAEALDFYRGYFEDAGEENEASVVAELGSPQMVAADIKSGLSNKNYGSNLKNPLELRQAAVNGSASYGYENKTGMDSRTKWILALIIGLVSFPIWMPILGSVFGVIVAIIAVAFALIVAMVAIVLGGLVGGIVCMVVGSIQIFATNVGVGILVFGIGLLLLALGAIGVVLGLLIGFKFIPWFLGMLSGLWHSIFKKGTGEIR